MDTKKKRRGGPIKRERKAILCRMSPDLASWVVEQSKQAGRSQSDFLESLIGIFRAVDTDFKTFKDEGGGAPQDIMQSLGEFLIGAMMKARISDSLMEWAWKSILDERREMIGWIKAEQAKEWSHKEGSTK